MAQGVDGDSFAPADGYLLEEQENFIEIPTPDFEATYKNIRYLIFDGFVPYHVNFYGVKLVMKGLNPDEFALIDMVESDPIRRIPLYFLYSIVFVDGSSILPIRSQLHEEAINFWLNLPNKVSEFIIQLIQAIQNAHSECFENLEGYLYEKESRYYWSVYGKSAIKNKMVEGMDKVGLNTAQESWVLFNLREDMKEEQERQFDHSKFIVSGMIGGKEVKKIETSERLRETEEKRRRQDVRLKNKKDKIKLGPSINTAEDLVEELNRQIRGEKDIHDQIIEQHEKQLREFMESRKSEMEQLSSMRPDLAKTEGSRSVTPEEMNRVMEEYSHPVEMLSMAADHYTSKIEQTAISKPSKPEGIEPPKAKRIVDMKPKSIFDPDVQAELEKLSKSDS